MKTIIRLVGRMVPSYVKTWLVYLKEGWEAYAPKRFKKFGRNSIIKFPRVVMGSEYIEVGERVYIGARAYLHAIDNYMGTGFSPGIFIGDDVYIGRDCYINATTTIEIHQGCVLSESVYLADQSHGLDPKGGLIMRQNLVARGPIRIGPHCFLGLRAVVMPGVVLGEHCVVGAGAIVTRSFPAYSMIAGNPARLLRTYDEARKEWVPVQSNGRVL